MIDWYTSIRRDKDVLVGKLHKITVAEIEIFYGPMHTQICFRLSWKLPSVKDDKKVCLSLGELQRQVELILADWLNEAGLTTNADRKSV